MSHKKNLRIRLGAKRAIDSFQWTDPKELLSWKELRFPSLVLTLRAVARPQQRCYNLLSLMKSSPNYKRTKQKKKLTSPSGARLGSASSLLPGETRSRSSTGAVSTVSPKGPWSSYNVCVCETMMKNLLLPLSGFQCFFISCLISQL